jgi:hypothetical protein
MEISLLDFSRGTDLVSLITIGACIVLGFIFGSLVKVKNRATGAEERSVLGGVEAAVLALVGAMVARLFIWLLLLAVDDLADGSVLLGHLFFLIPAIIDDFIALGGERVLTAPDGLLMLASVVGAGTGMMAGIWRIHDWKGLGLLAFPIDVTWGLAGQNYGVLLHLINFAWGEHGTETRTEGHRYARGFRLKNHPTPYAFTQGAVMSNLRDQPGTPLYRHEMTHIWQNRGFGPFYSLTYIGWMLVWLIPGFFAGALAKKPDGTSVGVGVGIERMCYVNCPWEVWAYQVQGLDRTLLDGPELVWSAVPVVIAAILVCGSVAAIGIALFILAL